MVASCFGIAQNAVAQLAGELPQEEVGVGVEERLGALVPLDLEFVGADGRPVHLRDCLKPGKPFILTLNYFNCTALCNLQLQRLAEGLRGTPIELGKDYNVVTVSIDPRETPARAAAAEKRYLGEYDRPVVHGRGWHFLTGKASDVQALASAVGFRYKWLADQKEFSHQAAVMVCSPEGKLCRYLYGVEFNPEVVRLSLVEASQGKLGSALDKIILFCFHYDATKGKYGPAAERVMRAAGGLSAVVLFGFLGWRWRREHRAGGFGPTRPVG